MSDKFESALRKLISLECWSVIAGKGTGSHASIDFGQRILRKRALNNLHLSAEQRHYVGEVSLMIRSCSWRIEHSNEVIGSWNDANNEGGAMLQCLDKLVGKKVERLALLRPGLDLNLYFTDALVLRLFCDQTDVEEGGTNYVYFAPQTIYAVGARSKLEVERRGLN